MSIFSKKKRHPITTKKNEAATIGAMHRWMILVWMWRFAIVDARIIAALIGCTKKTAVNKLRQVEKRELIQSQYRGGRKIYWLTQQGGREARAVAREKSDQIDAPIARLRIKSEPSRWPAPGNIPHELLAQIYLLRAMGKIQSKDVGGTIKRVAGSREFLAADPYWSDIVEYRGRPIAPDAAVHWESQKGADRYWFLEMEIDREKAPLERSSRLFHYHRMLLDQSGAEAKFVFASGATAETWSKTPIYEYRLDAQVYDGKQHDRWVRVVDRRGDHPETDRQSDRLKFGVIDQALRIYLPDYRR
ncbi:hypothetical protein [Algiphilus sp.]|uniref:hypothetical protein n=1 Tax=Algiphilus sp. TaxID=1872431 RepID=UPI0032EDE3CE